MLSFILAFAFDAHAFTETFTCTHAGAQVVNLVVRGRGGLPVKREMPVTARATEVRVGAFTARDVTLQGVASLSASGTYFELEPVHEAPFVSLTLTSYGPAELIDQTGARLPLDCGGSDLVF